MIEMLDGDIVPMTRCTVRIGRSSGMFRVPGKGKAFMFMLLGVGHLNDHLAFDAEKALGELGWVRAPRPNPSSKET